jgi:anti-sigma regulatory factor (Ser/Thr protein kinase)
MARHSRVLVTAAVILVMGVVVALAATVAIGLPVLLGVLGVLALAVGLLPRSPRRSRPRRPDGSTEMSAVAPKTIRASRSPERLWTQQWDGVPPAGTIAEVRTRVAAELADSGVHREQTEAALAVVTELLSNAVEHGCSPVRIQVTVIRGSVHVEVHDAGPGAPHTQPPDPHRLRGRGLHLVESLSTEWGWTSDQTGKTVWTNVSPGRPE